VVILLQTIPLGRAEEPSWEFDPPRLGHLIQSGGWAVDYQIGRISASPDFNFPIQLIYLSSRQDRGCFGDGWFCPQLDTRVIPRGNGVFVWYMPSGGLMGFRTDPKRAGLYSAISGEWQAKLTGSAVEIWNNDGWRFRYERSRLVLVRSPRGHAMVCIWKSDRLQEIRVLSELTNSQIAKVQWVTVLRAAYTAGSDCISALEITGQQSRFDYEKTKNSKLVMWTPPAGPRLALGYSKEGILAWTQVEKQSREDFKLFYLKPAREKDDRKLAANWLLLQDRNFTYNYEKDGAGNPIWSRVTIVDKAGGSRSFAYDESRGMLTEKLPDGVQRTTYFYRAPGQKYDGRLRMVEEGGHIVAEYRYNRRSGLLTESIDKNGVITFYDYPPSAGKKPFVAGQKGAAEFLPKPIRVRRGSRTQSEIVGEYSYNDLGQLVASKDKQGTVVRVSYTPRGEIAAVEDSTGNKTAFTYDPLGRCTSVDKNGSRQSVTYDAFGRIAAKTDPDGSKSETLYDGKGQVIEVRKDGKAQAQYARDALGRIIGERDPLGRIKRYDYDERGNLIAERAANGSVTRYEYDATNHRVAQIDGNGNRIRFDYDPAGRLIKQSNPLGKTLTWVYDWKGDLVARTNGVQTIAYAYDREHRPLGIDYAASAAAAMPPAAPTPTPEVSYFGTRASAAQATPASAPASAQRSGATSPPQTIAYTYDNQGRVLTASTPDCQFEYIRDKMGVVQALRCVEGNKEQLVRYRIDTSGRRTGLILAELKAAVAPTGGKIGTNAEYEVLQQTEYTYDYAGRLASIIDNGVLAASYAYDGKGRLVSKTFGNGMKAAISYDAMGRLAKIEFSGGPLTEPKVLAYTWDAASQVTNRSWAGATQRYEYDPSGQLLKVIEDPSGKMLEAYTYDKAGNMLEKVVGDEKTTMTYNAANELATRTVEKAGDGAAKDPVAAGPGQTSAASTKLTYHYDPAGRLLGYEGGPQNHYGWLDKLTDITMPDSSKVVYTYWPDGQLASKRVEEAHATPSAADQGATKDAEASKGDGLQQASNKLSTNNEQPTTNQEHFLWDGLALLRRNDTVYLIEPHPSGGVPIASHPAGASGPVTYYLNDMLGTTLATVQDSAVEYAQLTTFGQPLKMTNSTGPTPSGITPPSVPQTPTTPTSIPPSKPN
jgi:YD repeat-containing protein